MSEPDAASAAPPASDAGDGAAPENSSFGDAPAETTEAAEWRTEGGFFPVDSSGNTGNVARPCYHYFFKNASKKADELSAEDARTMAADFRKHQMFDEAAQADALAEQLERGDLPGESAEESEKAEGAPLLDGDPDPRAHIANYLLASVYAKHSLALLAVLALTMLFMTLVGCLAFDVKLEYDTLDGFKLSSGTVVSNYYGMLAAVQESQNDNAASTGAPARSLLTVASRQLLTPAFHPIPAPQQRTATWRINVIYEATGDNLLTHSSMAEIHELENTITGLQGYGAVCLVPADGRGCRPPNSAANVFYPSADTAQDRPVLDGLGINVGNVTVGTDALLKMGMYWYPGKELSPTNRKSRHLRTEFVFGTPLEGYDNLGSKPDEQKQIYLEFVNRAVKILEDSSSQNIKVYYGGDGVGQHQLADALWHDFALAAAGLVVVFLILWIRSNSVFIALTAIVQVLCCQTMAYFIYRAIFGIEYQTVLNGLGHLLSAVMVCGNLIFFLATYSKTNVVSFELKLAFTCRKTALPFCACASASGLSLMTLCFNDIQLLQTFGVYTTSIVIVNLLLSLTWLPICIAVHEKHLNHLPGPHQWLLGYEKEEEYEEGSTDHSTMGDDTDYNPVKDGKPDGEESRVSPHGGTVRNPPPSEGVAGLLHACSETGFPAWAAFLCTWKWFVIAGLALIFALSVASTSYFGNASHLPCVLPKSSNYYQYLTKTRDEFRTTGRCDSCGDPFGDNDESGGGSSIKVYVHSVVEVQGTDIRVFTDPDSPGMSNAFIKSIKNVTKVTGLVTITSVKDRGSNSVAVAFTATTSSIPKANGLIRKLKASIKNAGPAGFQATYVDEARKDPTMDSQFNPALSLVAGPTTSMSKSGSARLNAPAPATSSANSPVPGSTAASGTVDTSEGAILLKAALIDMDYQEAPPTESTLDLYLVWGISGYTSSHSAFSNPFLDVYGTAEFDNKFDLAASASQKALRDICSQVKVDKLVHYVIRCPMEDFSDWVTTQKKSDKKLHKFPTDAIDFYDLIRTFTSGPGKEFASDFGYHKAAKQVSWTRIHVRSKVKESASNSEKYKDYEAWQSYQTQLDRNYTGELTSAYHTSAEWVDVMTEKAAADGAKKALGVAFMFLIAVLTNIFGSIVLALLAAATVAQGVLFTLGILSLSGWTLGIVESVGICLLAGITNCTKSI